MKFIIDENELSGKTIESAKIVDDGEILAIRFTDNSCLVIKAKAYGDSPDIDLLEESEVRDDDLRDAGIISSDEYAERVDKAKKAEAEHKKAQELKILEELRRKYPDA